MCVQPRISESSQCARNARLSCVIWLGEIKMNISQPIASHIGSVDFGFLSSEEIKALSVKKIVNSTTFDSLLHPVPGGLYDSALGAWGDNL